jgi:tetratricopeptide (TPR) repeat protein
LHILWASLVQLQDHPTDSLEDVKRALQRAVELEKDAPAGAIELGHFLDTVEDDPKAACKAFSEGINAGRRLLIDGLLGQARALLQLEKRDEALQSLMEALYLANADLSTERSKAPNESSDFLIRDPSGGMQAFQLKGPFAIRIEDLLEELLPKRSA